MQNTNAHRSLTLLRSKLTCNEWPAASIRSTSGTCTSTSTSAPRWYHSVRGGGAPDDELASISAAVCRRDMADDGSARVPTAVSGSRERVASATPIRTCAPASVRTAGNCGSRLTNVTTLDLRREVRLHETQEYDSALSDRCNVWIIRANSTSAKTYYSMVDCTSCCGYVSGTSRSDEEALESLDVAPISRSVDTLLPDCCWTSLRQSSNASQWERSSTAVHAEAATEERAWRHKPATSFGLVRAAVKAVPALADEELDCWAPSELAAKRIKCSTQAAIAATVWKAYNVYKIKRTCESLHRYSTSTSRTVKSFLVNIIF